ncbi:ectopic P granules protein 5 homolog [Dreissena polymorpha]|nr:ectopic P granules protein 5 homolog [Dreissena polymorpha]
MTNMTQCCSAADVSFIETVTISVFEVSFICPETRDISSKMGRELLAEVVKCHPFILSVLVQRVNESLDKLGQMGIYFFKGLPLSSWLPTDPDLAVVRQWLLTSDLSSPANQMAQQILMNIHWGTTNKGNRLMVPWRIHKQVAVLVVEAYQRFIHGKHLGSMIMEGVKQMSAAVQQYQTTEQEFHAWCWNLLHRLVLHWTSLPSQDEHYAAQQGGAPDLNSDDSLLPLVKGVKEKNPTACYVALMVTKMGQNVNEFLSEGIRQLEVLTEQGLSRAIVSTVYYTLRMFVDNQKYILDSIRFQEVVLAVLHADESYFKVVKGLLSYDFPGPITKLFTSMILSQVEECGKEGNAGFVAAIDMWTRIVLQIPKWHLNRNCCCVLDHLIKAAFTNTQALQRVQKTFTEYYKKFCQQERGQGMVSSILTWVTSGIHLPSFMDKLSGGEFCWLAYIVLCLEGSYEVETRLWPALQEELLANPKAGTEQCLKKSIMKLKLDQAPVWGNLNIVRWANKALDMPEDHPVAVLVWQRFFGLYLGRLTTNQSTVSQRATVGERFFSTIGYSSYPKKMRKKLGQVADHYVKLSSETVDEDDEDAVSRKELHYRLSRLFQTFQLWVEEPLLHDATLYLPSLPIQYLAEKLLVVFQNHTAPWLEYLDLKGVLHELEVMTSEWKLSNTPEQNPKTKEPNETEALKLSGKEQILLRLSRMEEPLPPPPVPPIKPPVPEMSPGLAENKSAILHLLEADLTTLREYAGNHCAQVAGLKQLDEVYIDKVTRVFQNVGQQVTIEIRCSSMINPLHKCAKPGAITTWVDEKWTDKTIQRNVDENRAEYKQRLIACKVPFSKNTIVAAVHTENAITMLVKMYRGSTDEHRRANLCSIGCNLFFRMGEVITDSILQYPPTKQFFASCIDILGKEFVQCELQLPDQVLAMVLERQEIGGLLSPHFKPNLSPQTFVRMYGSLVQQIRHDRPGPERDVGSLALQVAAMLLSKFDMLAWLGEYSPSRQEVKTLIEHLSVAFIACGLKPELHYNTLYQVYLIHEKKLLQYRFPMYLHEVLAAILQGSSIQRVCVQCWEVLHSYCFHSNDLESRGHSDVCTMLSLDEIRNLMTWLGFEFMQMRLNVKQTSNFGLYSKWQPYVTYIARLLRDLSKCLLDKMLPNIADANTNDGLDMVWKAVVESYCPWIQTVTIQKVGCVPWIDSDRELAAEMVQSLTDFVAYAQYRTEDIHHRFFNDFLSLLWLYFATTLCVEDTAPTVVTVYNTQFAKLPWQQLVPNLAVMETMTRLKETGCSMGFNLVTDIMAAVGWKQVMEFYETHYDHNRLVQFEGCFFLLLIQAFSERKHIESPEIQDVMTQAQVLEWKHLSANDFKRASSWLLQSCDPKWLLLSRTSIEVLGLRIAETAAGFNTSVSAMLTEEWTTKRLGYLHCLSSLICQFTYLQDMNPASLSTVVLNLLTQIETVESAVVDTRTQIEESTDMVKEILSLLNNSNPDNKGSEVIMEVIMDWLRESPQTILLSPCIRAASRNLASLTYMVRIVEHCIELSFVPGTNRVQTVDPWSHILSALQVPELNLTEFFMACLNESSFLLLYSFLLQQVPLRQTLSEQQGVIEMVCDWTERAKPCSDNESKLLLWWFQAVDLILRQIDHGRDTVTCVMLIRKLMNRVKGFGEDRASEGLLGAIGLGRKSQLSERFRVCSRAFVAFCSLQIAGDSSLRLKPADPASSVPAVKLDVNNLLSIKTNKKYQPIRTQVDRVCEYVNDQSKCLRDAIGLLAMLKELFYADKHFLSLIES